MFEIFFLSSSEAYFATLIHLMLSITQHAWDDVVGNKDLDPASCPP